MGDNSDENSQDFEFYNVLRCGSGGVRRDPMRRQYPSQIPISTCFPPSIRTSTGLRLVQVPHPYLFFPCGGGCAFADDNIVGWTSSGTFQPGVISGQWQTGVPQATTAFKTDPLIGGTTPEPIVARAINATISQVVSTTAVVGAKYTLDVDLGF